MVAFCAIFFLAFVGARAQTFVSNTEYNFRQQSTAVGSSYGGDDAPRLTMDCLAANGYGQWTLSSTAGTGDPTNFSVGWYLLSNGLYTPSTHYDAMDITDHPGCIPPGVVQNGGFDATEYYGESKATANLDGSISYCWPDFISEGGLFFVQTFTASDVDLSLSFLANPTPPMNVVTSTIHSWPVSTWVGSVSHTIVSEADWRDNFDCCSDGYYNYFVWASTDHPLFTGQEEVWVMAVPIGSSTPVAGFPMMVDDGVNHDGKYPTITCDPRNNQIGTPSPAFDVAYLQPSVNGINCGSWSGAAWTTVPTALLKTYWDPTVTGPPHTTLSWTVPNHVRVIRNSVFGGTSSLAIYAIVNSATVTHSMLAASLLFYPPSSLFGNGNFVAGALEQAPSPIPLTFNLPVHDEPIIAFADPYDNQSGWHSVDEFHCLYQYDQGAGTFPNEYPLCIVRGSDVPEDYPPQPDAPLNPDTRLVLNQAGGSLEDDPTGNWYVAAVNQMGIHVHWIALNGTPSVPTHFYARDMNRTFDEPIDENTLVTDQCYVTDGSITGTNHGGTVGATLFAPWMTIWTDPNYGPPSVDGTSGLYSPRVLTTLDPYVGTLNFTGTIGTENPTGTDVTLTIGDNPGWDYLGYSGATLSVMPYFYCNFGQGNAQGITVNGSNTFNYFGLIATHDGSGNQTGVTTPFTDGTADGLGAGTIDLEGSTGDHWIDYPSLNIAGGANFYTGPGGVLGSNFMSNEGTINVNYEPSLFPTTSGSPNSNATGFMTLQGQTTLNYSSVLGNIPTGPSQVIITAYPTDIGGPIFQASNTSFSNSPVSGASEILLKGYTNYGYVYHFLYDQFSAIKIHLQNPVTGHTSPEYGNLTVWNSSFNDQHGRTIFVENDLAPTGLAEEYYNLGLGISDNTFGTINPNLDPDDAADGTYGIYVEGIDGNFAGIYPGMEGDIWITGNQFTSNNWLTIYPNYASACNECPDPTPPANLTYCAAICFENTTGNLLDNVITDNAYTNGIWLRATVPSGATTSPQSNTLLCDNTISHLHPYPNTVDYYYNPLTGIRTENHIGRSRLNTITDCQTGYWADGHGHSFMAYNTIDDYYATNPIDNGYITLSAISITSAPILGNTLDLSDATSNGGQNTARATYIGGDDGGWTEGLVAIGNNAQLLIDGGNNNFFLCNYGFPNPGPSTHPTVDEAYILLGLSGALSIPGVDHNFWGIDASSNPIDPAWGATNWNNAQPSQPNAFGISFSPSPTHTRATEDVPTGIDCSVSAAVTDPKGVKPLSMPLDTSCQHSYNVSSLLQAAGQYAAAYDTSMAFVERCPTDPHASFAFGDMAGDVGNGGNGPYPGALTSFRQWLISALPWNTNSPDYFCSDVFAIMQTFSTTDTAWAAGNTVQNEGLSVLYWLQQNPLCFSSYGSQLYINSRGSQKRGWLDTQDTSTTPLDTTIYTMQQLGLDSVLKYAGLLGVSNNTPSIIINASAYPNPTGEGTVISFGIAREAYVAINLYDVLGHQVSTEGFGGVVEPGNLSVPISLVGLPSGTYFARILTAYGEVQSVKLVKE
jgi:hypothetical protein